MKASTSIKVLAAALILASTTGVALAKNYKGEAGFKDYKDMPTCPPPVMLKDGWYLGAQVGYDSYRVREDIGGVANPVINNTGWVGGLFLGYGQYLTDLFYLGGEIFGNVNGSSVRNTYNAGGDDGTYTNKFTTNSSYGLALLPGLRLNDTSLGYVRLGWNWANLKGADTFAVDVASISSNRSKTANGFNLGLGIETLLMTNWSVRTEFNHTWYNSFSNAVTSYNTSDNQFMLGLLYHFA